MTSEEKRIFDDLLGYLQKTYPEVQIKRPYNDGYMEFYVNGTQIGDYGFNIDGRNLLYCVSELMPYYEFELR